MKAYIEASKRPSYNFVFAGILLLLYELSVALMPSSVINGVDGWFRFFLNLLPFGTYIVSGILLMVGAIYIYIDSKEGIKVRFSLLGLMFIESFLWGLIVFLILPKLMGKVFVNEVVGGLFRPNLIQQIGLSFGAGFYEELFFRLLLVWGLQLGMRLFANDWSTWVKNLIIVNICAFLFSLAHYIGNLGDVFEWYSFIYRYVFGVGMSVLLIFRRFGITSWTHALYDVFVFTAKAL